MVKKEEGSSGASKRAAGGAKLKDGDKRADSGERDGAVRLSSWLFWFIALTVAIEYSIAEVLSKRLILGWCR